MLLCRAAKVALCSVIALAYMVKNKTKTMETARIIILFHFLRLADRKLLLSVCNISVLLLGKDLQGFRPQDIDSKHCA